MEPGDGASGTGYGLDRCQRQRDPYVEGRASAGVAVDLDLAPHGLDGALRDEEADAGTLGVARQDVAQTHEAIEDALLIDLRDARSLVGDREPGVTVLLRYLHCDQATLG